MSSKSLEKGMYFEWKNIPKEEKKSRGLPMSQKEMGKQLGVDEATTKRWNLEFRTFDLANKTTEAKKYTDLARENIDEALGNRDLTDEEKIKFFDKCLFELVKDSGTRTKPLMELFARRYGLLLDNVSQTHTFEIGADEHFRIRKEAQRRISEVSGGTDGTGGLRQKQRLLSDKVREDKG